MQYLKYVSILFAFITCYSTAQNLSFNQTLDSIQKLRKLSQDNNINYKQQLVYAKNAVKLSKQTGQDTIILKSSLKEMLVHFFEGKFEDYYNLSNKNKRIAEKINHVSSQQLIYDFLGFYFYSIKSKIDSSYYYYIKADKLSLHSKSKQDYDSHAIRYLAIATIEFDTKNYTNAENYAIKGVKALELSDINETNLDTLWSLYNLLGLISKDKKDFLGSHKYFQKALLVNKRLPQIFFDNSNGETYDRYLNTVHTKINIAESYIKNKKYSKANEIYGKLLNDKIVINKDLATYAAILTNHAFSQFLIKELSHDSIKSKHKRALAISKKLNLNYEITSINNNIAELFLSINKKDSALVYLKHAYPIAKKINRTTEMLRSLDLLSKATSGEESNQYLQEYIKLSDSMIDVERNMRNKFARIQFETDEIIAQNKKITKDKKQISFLAFLFLIIALLTYIIYSQRLKNKELKFEQEQQRANEDVYSLMLSQQSKIETSKNDERKRISEELHDGILGKLFGTRIGLGVLATKLSGDTNSMEKFQDHIKNIQAVEFEVREISHELNNNKLNKKTDFKALIDHYLSTQADLHLFEYTLTVDKEIASRDISDRIKVELYRILQESLFNIIKHAQAEAVIVSFFIDQNHIVLSIQDDGIGFNTEKKSNGIGLNNINSRMSKLDGELTINSIENKGTTVKVKIPIPD